MRSRLLIAATVLLSLASTATAAPFTFTTDPFAGTTVLTTPGRQVVGNELFIPVFDITKDKFVLDPGVFGISEILFANDLIGNIPTADVNFVVLRTFDDDGDPLTTFNAGSAANLIAAQVTATGPGFFIYFNQGLDLPRLVFSTDLGDATADLKIVARLLNFGGQAGRDAMVDFTKGNVKLVPEPATMLLLASAGAVWMRRRQRAAAR